MAELAAPKSDSESINPFAQSPAQIQPFDDGILRQDAAAFRLPNALAEAGESDSHSWMPGRFVIFVVIAAIIFISMVAWQVSQMPAK